MAENSIASVIAAIRAGDYGAVGHLRREEQTDALEPGDALTLPGWTLHQQGRSQSAVEACARLVRLYPNAAAYWSDYASALHATGDMASAEQAAETACSLAPEDPQRLSQLGRLQLESGKPLLARDTLLRAFGQAPDSAEVRIDAARACAACRDSRAENLLRPWREWLPLDEWLQFDLACVLVQIGAAMDALEVVEELAQRAPKHRHARLLLASMYERINRLNDAESLLQAVDTDSENDPEIRCLIGHQRARLATRRGDHIAARKLLENLGPVGDEDYGYWFTLAQVYDRLGDVQGAMRALEAAHARQRQELQVIAPHRFDPEADVLPGAGWRVHESDFRSWPRLRAPGTAQSPVFVIGFPRSGTTLLEQMLDAHPLLQSMDEQPFFNTLSNQLDDVGIQVPRDLGRLTQRDCDELRKAYLVMACSKVQRRWTARLVDKNPMNMLWLPMIHRLFPEARFILAIRHPCDVILSCYMQNFRAALLASAALSLERLARAYVEAMESWLYHAQVFKPDVFVCRHEDLVADPHGQTRRIARFLGLSDAGPMLQFAERARQKGYIKTPSYTQVIEAINRNGIDRWKRYGEYFETVLPVLRPLIVHWGYAPDAAPLHAQR